MNFYTIHKITCCIFQDSHTVKLFPLFFTFIIYSFSLLAQTQVGSDLNGDVQFAGAGSDLDISADGSIVTIGLAIHPGGGAIRGQVRVYQFNGTDWVQLGNSINGEADNNSAGAGVALSSNGNMVAVGASGNAGGGTIRGHVRVFQRSGNTWNQLGTDIDGEADNDGSGSEIALSADGNIIAIGSAANIAGGAAFSGRGHVRVFQFSGGNWNQLGSDIDGTIDFEQFGSSVALSSDGTILAVGALANPGNGGSNRGQVRVFQYNGSTWLPLGNNINGAEDNAAFGSSVALSNDGNILAIGASGASGGGFIRGEVKVFQLMSNTWTQVGDTFNGTGDLNQLGTSVDLSANGNIIAIGASGNSDAANGAGHIRIFQRNGSNWVQVGNNINGAAELDAFGANLALNADGSSFAGASPGNKAGFEFNGTGQVRIFNTGIPPTPVPVELIHFSVQLMPSGAKLIWQTSSESYNEGFQIEKSKDGSNWEKIGFVKGNGNSTQVTEYAFLDTDPIDGLNYYRLKQIDFDQSFAYSPIRSLQWEKISSTVFLNVYPNPSNSQIQVEWSGEEAQEARLISSEGRVLQSIEEPTLINVSDLPEGVYFLQLYDTNSQELDSKKVIIKN